MLLHSTGPRVPQASTHHSKEMLSAAVHPNFRTSRFARAADLQADYTVASSSLGEAPSVKVPRIQSILSMLSQDSVDEAETFGMSSNFINNAVDVLRMMLLAKFRKDPIHEGPYFDQLRYSNLEKILSHEDYDITTLISVSDTVDEYGKKRLLLSFHGTRSVQNILLDLQLGLDAAGDLLDGTEYHGDVTVCRGFLHAFHNIIRDIFDKILEYLTRFDGEIGTITFSGYSLGGVLATMLHFYVTTHFRHLKTRFHYELVTFGAPPFMNQQLHDVMELNMRRSRSKAYHFFFPDDPVVSATLFEFSILNEFHYQWAPGARIYLKPPPFMLTKDIIRHYLVSYELAFMTAFHREFNKATRKMLPYFKWKKTRKDLPPERTLFERIFPPEGRAESVEDFK